MRGNEGNGMERSHVCSAEDIAAVSGTRRGFAGEESCVGIGSRLQVLGLEE